MQAYNKAIVAVVMSLLTLANQVWGIDLGIGEDTVTAILAVLTPLFVYLIPNKGYVNVEKP